MADQTSLCQHKVTAAHCRICLKKFREAAAKAKAHKAKQQQEGARK